MARCFAPEKGKGSRPEAWRRLKEALVNNLLERQADHEFRLPEGFSFSLREEDAHRAVTPSVLEGLLERSLTDGRPFRNRVYSRLPGPLDGPGGGILLAGIQIACSPEW